ncbi:hypothetical protein K4039_28055 [Lyngbya sp. CCAP 1446/10]|uniref:hypothetical protein n=1 Tax=Lyngbya sp. CCAP 1446/10 TaxID=439293 RepID=UPI0022386184|nr:hypothetical protein [Lyngbya sp. CCAP 1446/10]MCW6053800.1 hypothetical protein [Lyngbya sp. CCAP 1446/10]
MLYAVDRQWEVCRFDYFHIIADATAAIGLFLTRLSWRQTAITGLSLQPNFRFRASKPHLLPL